jgi:histidine triad (HIT) family protein
MNLATRKTMSEECPFCQILNRQKAAEILYEDDQVLAFKDILPIAPVHILVIPRKHIHSLNDIEAEDEMLLGHMLHIGQKLAVKAGVGQSGYRLVINTGPHAGQSIFHVHLHVIGGRHLPFRFE